MRSGFNSWASTGIINSRAPLMAASPDVPGFCAMEEMAVTRVMLPPSFIYGKAACRVLSWGQNFPSNPSRRSCKGSSAKFINLNLDDWSTANPLQPPRLFPTLQEKT
jgi:hypothetical protein